MDYASAIRVIENCAGFTEDDTPVGEAWSIVLGRIQQLEEESAALRVERACDQAVFDHDFLVLETEKKQLENKIRLIKSRCSGPDAHKIEDIRWMCSTALKEKS